VAFVLLAVVALPVPSALAQPPARPDPQELWRQFPLEQAPPKTQPESPSPASSTTDEEGRGWIVAIAVTAGLLLVVVIGLFGYVSRAQVALRREDVTRRLRSAVATNGQRFGVASRARRRSPKRAAANELTRLKEMLATYVARVPAEHPADEHVEKLKAKLDVQPPTSDTEHHEVAILKAKRGELAGSGGTGGPGEAELLKAKLADSVAGTTRPRKAPGTGSKQPVSR
jgi:hypothetical protein